MGRLWLAATVGGATRTKKFISLGEISLKKQSCSNKMMHYLVINAIMSIFCDSFGIFFYTSIYWRCSYPDNSSCHGDWITGRVHEAESCARAPFFRFFFFFGLHRSPDLQLQTSPPAGERSAQSEWNCHLRYVITFKVLFIYLFDIAYDLKLKYNFTQTSTCACLFTLPCVTLPEKIYIIYEGLKIQHLHSLWYLPLTGIWLYIHLSLHYNNDNLHGTPFICCLADR